MRIDYSDRAEQDLDAALDNYLLVSARAAQEFAEAHDSSLEHLRRFPYLGTTRRDGLRSFPIDKSGYRFVYRIRGEVVRVLRLQNVRRER